jgi:hypothetical protein
VTISPTPLRNPMPEVKSSKINSREIFWEVPDQPEGRSKVPTDSKVRNVGMCLIVLKSPALATVTGFDPTALLLIVNRVCCSATGQQDHSN